MVTPRQRKNRLLLPDDAAGRIRPSIPFGLIVGKGLYPVPHFEEPALQFRYLLAVIATYGDIAVIEHKDCFQAHGMNIALEIERCRREIAAMEQHSTDPAWLVTLGISDWQHELDYLEKTYAAHSGSVRPSNAPENRIPAQLHNE